MPKIVQGRIVFAIDPIPDPYGKNAKPRRPFVVVSPPKEIESGGDLHLVAITHDVFGDDVEVQLPYGRNCSTYLRDKCAAICSWDVRVPETASMSGKESLSRLI